MSINERFLYLDPKNGTYTTNEEGILDAIKLKRIPFFKGQEPFLTTLNFNRREFYLWDDHEGKIRYERQLLLEATKENAVNKTTSKRRM